MQVAKSWLVGYNFAGFSTENPASAQRMALSRFASPSLPEGARYSRPPICQSAFVTAHVCTGRRPTRAAAFGVTGCSGATWPLPAEELTSETARSCLGALLEVVLGSFSGGVLKRLCQSYN